MAISVAYFTATYMSNVYFLGMCFYIHAMVDDLGMALSEFDRRLQGKSKKHRNEMNIHRALIREIQFHNDIIE